MSQFQRTEMLIGKECMAMLSNAHIAVFGLGGVGSFSVEALVRCGVGRVSIIDHDIIQPSNLNRQLFALNSTVGRYKVDVAKERLLDINPRLCLTAYKLFFSKENSLEIDFGEFDYCIDAIDSVASKLEIITRCHESNTSVISCMGTGNKLDPSQFEFEDIFSTSVCPLARVMRGELRKRGIEKLKVLYSKELPIKPSQNECESKHITPASISFVPSVAGLFLASEVVNDLRKH